MFVCIYFQIVYHCPFLTHFASSFKRKSIIVGNSQKLFPLRAYHFHNGWSYISYSPYAFMVCAEGITFTHSFPQGKIFSVKINNHLLRLLLRWAGPHNLQIMLPAEQFYSADGYIWRQWTCSDYSVRSSRDKTVELLLKIKTSLFTETYITIL